MQQQTQHSSAVVVVVEGLGPGLVGAYGSSTAVTPALDRLAAQGVLLDQCFVDSQSLPEQLRSLWTAQHALHPAQASVSANGPAVAGEPWSLWHECQRRATEANWQTRLLTDCPLVAEVADALGCRNITVVEPHIATIPAEDSAQCTALELFATAAELLKDAPPGLIWIHSRGLRHPWDAPLALRQQFVDPEDPDPPQDVAPPALDVTTATDPDLLVGWGQVAAAQAAVIDEAISALRDTVALRADADCWHWLFTSLGSVPLGEHGRLGWGRPQLFGTELQTATMLVPALQSHVPHCPVGQRRPELFQLPDIAASLAAMLRFELPTAAWGRSVLELGAAQSPARWPKEFQLAMVATAKQQWLRSPAWSAVLMGEMGGDVGRVDSGGDSVGLLIGGAINDIEEGAQDWLFVKPEDRWEVSQIADRRRDVVTRHRQLAPLFLAAVLTENRAALPVLDDELLNLLR